MELPPCRSSLMSVSTCRRYGFSACSANRRKMRRADTCASKSVAICRERITRSREDTRSKKVMLLSCSARVFCPPPWMAVRVSPLCWSSVMAASCVEALTVPLCALPFWSSASYLNSAIDLQQPLEVFGSDGAGVGVFYRDFARAHQVGKTAVHVYHPLLPARLDEGLDFVGALLADKVGDGGVVVKKLVRRDKPAGDARDKPLAEDACE